MASRLAWYGAVHSLRGPSGSTVRSSCPLWTAQRLKAGKSHTLALLCTEPMRVPRVRHGLYRQSGLEIAGLPSRSGRRTAVPAVLWTRAVSVDAVRPSALRAHVVCRREPHASHRCAVLWAPSAPHRLGAPRCECDCCACSFWGGEPGVRWTLIRLPGVRRDQCLRDRL